MPGVDIRESVVEEMLKDAIETSELIRNDLQLTFLSHLSCNRPLHYFRSDNIRC